MLIVKPLVHLLKVIVTVHYFGKPSNSVCCRPNVRLVLHIRSAGSAPHSLVMIWYFKERLCWPFLLVIAISKFEPR